HRRARPPVPRPGSASVRLLRLEPAGHERSSRADLRRQGGGFHRRTRRSDGSPRGSRNPVPRSRRSGGKTRRRQGRAREKRKEVQKGEEGRVGSSFFPFISKR